MAPSRPVCAATRSAAADSPCLAVAVPPKHGFTRASDASPRRLGLPVLAGCGSLPRSVVLRCSPLQLPRQTGRSDLCSRHQRGSADRSSSFVIRVTRLCGIRRVCRKLARDSRSVALTTTRAPSDLSMMIVSSIQRVSWHAAWARLCQIARKRSKPRLFSLLARNGAVWSCSCEIVCLQVMR